MSATEKSSSKKSNSYSSSLSYPSLSSSLSFNATTDVESDELFPPWTLEMSIVDYEKELMQKRHRFLYELKKKAIDHEFLEFMSVSKSVSFVFAFNLIVIAFIVPPFFSVLSSFPSSSALNGLMAASIAIFALLSIIPGCLLFDILRETPLLFKCCRKVNKDHAVARLQWIWFISLVLFHGLVLINRVSSGQCLEHDFLSSYHCNPYAEVHDIPTDTTFILIMLPTIFAILLREARLGIIFLAYGIILVCIVYSLIHVQSLSSSSLIFLLFSFLTSILMIGDSYKQYLLFYLLTRQLKKIIEMNKRLSEEARATEMRTMIANVAHDLKTPLSSFMTGVDIISADIADLSAKLSKFLPPTDQIIGIDAEKIDQSLMNAGIHPEYLHSFISGLQSCLFNIRNTNSFMLMTINRCLDYTKASNGLKLVPKNETIHLMETLKMPLQCMTNIQNKIHIHLLPIEQTSKEMVCSHIITDKQWLQENILCLLSNAVKYSAEGEVEVKVALLTKSEQVPMHRVDTFKVPFRIEDEVITPAKNSTHRVTSDDNETTVKMLFRRSRSHLDRMTRKVRPENGCSSSIPSAEEDGRKSTSRRPLTGERSNSEQGSSLPAGELMFEVIDTGIGLTEEGMKSLFNPFKQTQRLAGGTGLGLYSLAKRVEALKGKYGVHQREDGKQGSVFWFSIPYKPDTMLSSMSGDPTRASYPFSELNELLLKEKKVKPVVIEGSSENGPQPFHQRKEGNRSGRSGSISGNGNGSGNGALSILIAEDTPSIAKMTTMMLRRQNHQTEVAENGQIVLDKLFKDHPSPHHHHDDPSRSSSKSSFYDVVLMDLQMPVMDGLEATRRIRAYEKENFLKTKIFSHQIVIGVSANSDYETAQEASQAGIDDFLPKPFSVEAFLQSVKRIQEKISDSREKK